MELKPAKRIAVSFTLMLLLLAAAVVLPPRAQSETWGSADDGWAYGAQGGVVHCFKATDPYGHELVYAHLTTTMWVHNKSGLKSGYIHWARNMRLAIRLIPPNSGSHYFENWDKAWKTTRYPVFSQLPENQNFTHRMAIRSDTQSATPDWQLQEKFIWDRKAPIKDIVRQYTIPFDSRHCFQGQLPPLLPTETPAVPNPG